nr:hypothetical protein [Tanacetum cinerariifolium]
NRLLELGKTIDQGRCNEEIVNERSEILKELHDLNASTSLDLAQKIDVVECNASYDEIKKADWECGINKSPGRDGFTFEFFRRYWDFIHQDVVAMVLLLFSTDLVSDDQSAFASNCQILDGPFILNKLLSWHKYKNTKVMIHKVDFVKAFDLVRWGFLDGVLHKFGFGDKWRGWIQGCLSSAIGFIPVNGLYKGIRIDDSLSLSHLFYADDVMFINLRKSKIMGIGIPHDVVATAASFIGCATLTSPFNYLGVKVGGIMSRLSSWDEVIDKFSSRLSKWKLKTLSIGGHLTLIKSVISSLPLPYFSIFKVPKGNLNRMEASRRNFFNGVD